MQGAAVLLSKEQPVDKSLTHSSSAVTQATPPNNTHLEPNGVVFNAVQPGLQPGNLITRRPRKGHMRQRLLHTDMCECKDVAHASSAEVRIHCVHRQVLSHTAAGPGHSARTRTHTHLVKRLQPVCDEGPVDSLHKAHHLQGWFKKASGVRGDAVKSPSTNAKQPAVFPFQGLPGHSSQCHPPACGFACWTPSLLRQPPVPSRGCSPTQCINQACFHLLLPLTCCRPGCAT